MKQREYLTLVEVLYIHKFVLAGYGGAEGVRDMGALESAVLRPCSGYYESLLEEAAALLESLVMNHPFIDGNKRTAITSCDVFLRIHGFKIEGESQKLHQKMISLIETRSFTVKNLVPWLEEIVVKE